MKVILAITLAITIELMVSQHSASKHGTIHTMDNPTMIVVTTGK
jgi:hypothetical protein